MRMKTTKKMRTECDAEHFAPLYPRSSDPTTYVSFVQQLPHSSISPYRIPRTDWLHRTVYLPGRDLILRNNCLAHSLIDRGYGMSAGFLLEPCPGSSNTCKASSSVPIEQDRMP
jgi:hypothetical protein